MCLHSRMGNNNWLKQSLLWENKRPAGVGSEGQAWWHSKYLNSHWLLGRQRALSSSRSSSGGDRFTQPLGLGMLLHSHLPLLGLQSHLFPLQCHRISLTAVLLVLTARNQREMQFCARDCLVLLWPIALWSWSWADERVGGLCPALCVWAVMLWPSSCRTSLLKWEAIMKLKFICLTCLFVFSRLIFSLSLDFFNPELFSLSKWLNEGVIEIFPYSRNLFMAVGVRKCICLAFQNLGLLSKHTHVFKIEPEV